MIIEQNVERDQHSLKMILVVEDELNAGQRLIEAVRAETSYHPLLVVSGEAALLTVATLTPDLLLTDYHLPDMSGSLLYQYMHRRIELSHLPVLFVDGKHPHEMGSSRLCPTEPAELSIVMQMIRELLD